jgi:hypothetical protein
MIGFNLTTHGAHVRIECANTYDHLSGKAESLPIPEKFLRFDPRRKFLNSLDVAFNRGSRSKKIIGGNPPKSSALKALCPAEQTPLFISLTCFPPVRRKGIQSQCSPE